MPKTWNWNKAARLWYRHWCVWRY